MKKKINKNLKTLKNLELKRRNVINDAKVVLVDILKQEAIKWIKFIRKHLKEIHYDNEDHDNGSEYHEGQIDWIELFFNLKEKNSK